MNNLFPHQEGDLTVEEARTPYFRCYKCDKVLKDEKDRYADKNGIVHCLKCVGLGHRIETCGEIKYIR
jgi:hypothetical protein